MTDRCVSCENVKTPTDTTRRLLTLGRLGVAGTRYGRTKALVLLAYLSLEGPQPRRRLARLFWPTAADPLNQLSLTLSRVGKDLPGVFRADATSVEARVSCDAVDVRANGNKAQMERALELHEGEFLYGVAVRSVSSELHEWIEDTRDDLARSMQRALLAMATKEIRAGNRVRAADFVRRAVRTRDISLLDADGLLFAHDVLATARDPSAQRLRAEAEDLGLELRSTLSLETPRPDPSANAGVTRLIGRRAESRRLHELLASSEKRLVTVTGAGGMGKSLLAATAAAAVAPSYPGGVAHVACDACDDSTGVVRAAMEALGVTPPAVGPTPEHLSAALRDRAPTLLVFDDFDHLVDRAGWLSGLLRSAPNASVLVTANQPIGSAYEYVLPLPGLSSAGPQAGEVGELFMERALRADASFELRPNDVEHVVELGRLTGGNPLAVGLAAAWVAVVPVADIVRELTAGLQLLATDAHDAPSRHRSILAVFEHTWELLGEADRNLLLRLSVLNGSFDRVTAAAVAGVNLPVLASLCRKSLLVRPAPGRFECPPIFRRWVGQRWGEDADLRAATRQRHAAHFLAVARAAGRAFDTPEGGQWLGRLDLERRDVIAALQWCWESGDTRALLTMLQSLGQYWIRRGRLDSVFPWYERAATLTPAKGSERDLVAVLRLYAYALNVTGDHVRPGPLLERALALAQEVHALDAVAQAANALGVLAVYRRDLSAAADWYHRAMLAADESSSDGMKPFILNNLGDLHYFNGRFDQAAEHYLEAVERSRVVGNLQMTSNVLGALGTVALRQGRLAEARSHLRESLRLVQELGITFSFSAALDQYAALLTASGQPAAAARLWGAADALRGKLGTTLDWFAADERAHWQAKAGELLAPGTYAAEREAGEAMHPEAALEFAVASLEGR